MKNRKKIIYLAGFLFSLAIATASYINSSFLGNYVEEKYVGAIYIAASIATIWGLLRMPLILNRLGNLKTALLSSLFFILSVLFLALSNNPAIIISAFVVYFMAIGFIVASLDIFLEDLAKEHNIGSLRGLYLMTVNFAWIFSQIISGNVINSISFPGIYLLGAIFMVIVLIIFLFFVKGFKDPEYKHVPLKTTLKTFTKNKHLSRIYASNLILQFFYAWMVIYTPIYLHEYIGFGWDKIGIIFSIMLIPFVLVDYPLGKFSDKIGEKEMLLAGFFIVAFSTLIIPFINGSNIIVWTLLLFITRAGAATIEVMNESYFFKVTVEKRANEVSFYRNASSVSYILGPALAILLLLILPSFKYLFFILGAILILGLWIALKLEDVK